MFMDPNAFEAEDIERELRDAGIDPETTVGSTASEIQRNRNVGRDDPFLAPGKSSTAAPPSSGSHVELHSSGIPEGKTRTTAGGDTGGERGPDHNHFHQHQPRALAENLGGNVRRHKATPSYGRHSKGGGSWSTAAQGQSQVSPPPSTPPSNNSGSGSNAFGHGDDGGNRAGDEGKLREGSPETYATGGSPASSSSATGVRSRARVLAQQREIQRKRRQQALSSGGIRPSDAASLSRGLVSSGPARSLPRRPSEGAGADGHQEDGLLNGSRDGDEGKEAHTSFSPSVKQFSAPRQVEGDAYTAFNSTKRTSAVGLSEFERRRSIGQIGLSDSDEEREEGEDKPASANGDGGGGGGRRRRNNNKAAPDMGSSTSPKESPPTEEADTGGQYAETEHSRAENGRGSRHGNRPNDWDDRNRPSTKTYQWGRGSGDEESDEAGTNSGKGSGAWRSVGRKSSGSSRSPVPTNPKTKTRAKNNIHDDVTEASNDHSADGPEEESSTDDSESSRSYISSGSSRSSRSSSASSSPRRPSWGGGEGRHSSYKSGRSRGGRGDGRSDSVSSSRSSRFGSDRSSSASASASDGGRHRRGSPPRRRHVENGKPRRGGPSKAREGGSGGSGPGAGRGIDGKEERRYDHRRSGGSGSNELSDSGRYRRSKSGNASAEAAKSSKGGNKRNKNNGGEQGSDERSKEGGGGGLGGRGERQEEKEDEEVKKDDDGQEESKSSGRREKGGRKALPSVAHDRNDGKGGAPPAGSGAGDRRGDEGDGVPTAPSAAVAGAGVGPAGELEFNMAAIDLSDMKRFLMSPCPRAAGVVQCYIRRNKTRANKLFPEYTLFMKEGDRFLMCSKKRPNNATSNYLVSMRAGDLDRNSTNFLGKLRANFVGTEFQVFDDGYSPKEQTGAFGGGWGSGNHGSGSGARNQPMREELGCVMYASNVLGSRGPRKMQVAIPAVSEAGVVSKWSELDGGASGSKAIDRVKNRDYDGSLYMVNKPPRWNDQVGAYVLNFYGRVTMASVKNFQLVSTEDFDRIILQFGRVARDEFTMDFQYPISPFQAFAITLSSFDSKIACD
eukprot:g6510.t1